VKWNRKDENILASSHSKEVLVWDRRVRLSQFSLSGWLILSHSRKDRSRYPASRRTTPKFMGSTGLMIEKVRS
jgi:hypothetical protein